MRNGPHTRAPNGRGPNGRGRNGRGRNGHGRNGGGGSDPGTGPIHCAIYTRKSTDEGLDRDFNSLDAQREAAEAYVASQAANGWELLPERFDDGGFSGGTLERPALKQLLACIQAGQVQKIICYKIDRLSRSLLDFAELARIFEQHGVGIVSVTQQLDTSTSMGRLTMNMLLSFAQFEREMVSDRTRDKLRAARRKGKFVGGGLILGYDRHPDGGRLVVNDAEAERVREIFGLFEETGSIIATVEALNRRGWTLKRWTTKAGRAYGGGVFDKYNLKRLLTNYAYIGEVAFDGQVFPAEHEPIVDRETWDRVQELMRENGTGSAQRRSTQSLSLLAGLLRCLPCGCAMTPTYSQRRKRRYRYYLCLRAHRQGRAACPTRSVAAAEIERFVLDRIRAIGRNPELVAATAEQARVGLAARRRELEAEVQDARKALEAAHAAARAQIGAASVGKRRRQVNGNPSPDVPALEEHLARLREEQASLRGLRIDPADLRAALAAFDPVWAHLTSAERQRLVRLLIERIDYDGAAGKIAVTFSPAGVRTLAVEGVAPAEAAL